MNNLIERTTPWLNTGLLIASFVCAAWGIIFFGANDAGNFMLIVAIFCLEARRL